MPVETMADDIDDVDALLEEPYQKVSPCINCKSIFLPTTKNCRVINEYRAGATLSIHFFIFLINVWSLVLFFSILNEPFKTDWSTFCVSGFARLSELGDQCSSCPSVADRSSTEDSKILFETFVCVTITTSLLLALPFIFVYQFCTFKQLSGEHDPSLFKCISQSRNSPPFLFQKIMSTGALQCASLGDILWWRELITPVN